MTERKSCIGCEFVLVTIKEPGLLWLPMGHSMKTDPDTGAILVLMTKPFAEEPDSIVRMDEDGVEYPVSAEEREQISL